jgi:hypothetical protein
MARASDRYLQWRKVVPVLEGWKSSRLIEFIHRHLWPCESPENTFFILVKIAMSAHPDTEFLRWILNTYTAAMKHAETHLAALEGLYGLPLHITSVEFEPCRELY